MGAYYIETQFADKAVNYFEKASIMQLVVQNITKSWKTQTEWNPLAADDGKFPQKGW